MKVKVGLETVVSELPETVVTAREQSYLEPVIPEPLRGKFKFPDEVRRLRDENAAEILGEKVARKALDRAQLKPSDIHCIISNNCGGKFNLPMVGAHIHHKLEFAQEIPAVNVSNAGASFVDACEVAWNLVLAGEYKRILIVTVSARETRGGQGRADLTDPMSACMGDGAGAAIVSSQNLKCEFLSYYNRTFGETHDFSATALKAPANPGLKGAGEQPPTAGYLRHDPRFFDWWQEHGEQFGIDGINGALKEANLTLAGLDMVLPHQPAPMLYDAWMEGAAKAGLSKDKWKHTFDKYGDVASAVIPVNLAEFWEKGEFKKDSIIALLTFGAGGHAPTMLIKWLV